MGAGVGSGSLSTPAAASPTIERESELKIGGGSRRRENEPPGLVNYLDPPPVVNRHDK